MTTLALLRGSRQTLLPLRVEGGCTKGLSCQYALLDPTVCVGGQRREDPAGLGPLFQPDTGALGIAGLPLWVRELFSIVDTFSCVPESCT